MTVVATSTANDRLSEFDLNLNGITLTTQSGKTVTLLPSSEHVEFTNFNGTGEPLFTAVVPQDTYTSASIAIGGSKFACASGNSAGTVSDATYAWGPYLPASEVTTSLPADLSVSGTSMNLSLNLLVSESAIFPSTCVTSSSDSSSSLTPNFNLTVLTSSSGEQGLEGVITSIDAAGNTLTVASDDGFNYTYTASSNGLVLAPAAAWQVNTSAGTVFQGVSGLSGLAVGTPVNMDVSFQAGGVLATRIQAEDTNPANVTVTGGQVLAVFSDQSNTALEIMGREETGTLWANGNLLIGEVGFRYENAAFHISGQLSNLQSLPFVPAFTAKSAVAGQNVTTTSHDTAWGNNPNYPELATVTLIPQTINGTVTAVSSQDGFDVYAIALASYDIFPQLAVQTNQKTLLTSPSTVIVYADSSATRLNTQPITVGSVARFNGVVFNDQGTLRMDCLQINDGVAE